MGYEFEQADEALVDATPEQVWEAIATGPGIDSWFMGRNEVLPGPAGSVRMTFGDYSPESAVTAWEPSRRFAHRTPDAPDGRFIAYEFLIEGRGGGSTVLRTVTSGFLPGDDWADEFEAMTLGGALFFHTLVEYLNHFAGRTATPLTVFGPPVDDWTAAWAALRAEIGTGDRVRIALDGGEPIDGVVYFQNTHTLGIRTGDALYRFLQGFHGPMIAAHHVFSAEPVPEQEKAWQSWMERVFAPSS
jgi:uncharacterized protein YndB with AHSA1/START domain